MLPPKLYIFTCPFCTFSLDIYNFTIEKLVSLSYMSNTHFRKLFTRKYGVTPAKYIISRRMAYAKTLLSSGKYSINEVCEKSGFGDAKYFSRAVKKEYGFPPSQLYRRIKLNNDN